MAERRAKETSRGPLGFAGLSNDSDQTIRLALILKTDAQGSIAAVKHMRRGDFLERIEVGEGEGI